MGNIGSLTAKVGKIDPLKEILKAFIPNKFGPILVKKNY